MEEFAISILKTIIVQNGKDCVEIGFVLYLYDVCESVPLFRNNS